jgi:aspartate beta-hydroxylase
MLSQQGLADAMAGVEKGAVKVSRLTPGTTIKPHCAAVNDRIRVHLALAVPDGDIGIRVAGEGRRWEEGQLLVFDDSFEHSVWHRGSTEEDRIVLIVDLRHPDLPYEK